jgi:fatty-acyl-CoA synthase
MSTWEAPTASSLVFRALRRHPERVAFAWDGGTLSYAGALDLIGRLQAVLHDGSKRAPRVAFLSANRADVWCAEAAVQALGGSVTWLHPMGALPDQLEQLADAQAHMLVVDSHAFHDRGGELAARSQLGTVWTLGPASFGRDLLAAAARAGNATARDLSQPDEIATLNYTGGTTGKSKAAVRRQRAHAAMWRAILADFEIPARPRYLAAAPISHVAGTKVAPVLLRGGTVHLLQRFDPGEFLATVQRERINMSLLVPTMVYTLLDHPALASTDLSSLELLLYGASPMSPTRLVEAIERIGPVFSQLYGQTECYPVSLLRRGDHDVRLPELFASCGAPIASTEVCLLGPDDQPVAGGEPGEICVRAPHAMEGYWQRDDLTAETLSGGWLHTGDIARADPQGHLFIVDRKKDMIVSGGFNVYPREIEDVLTGDPAVAMAAVIGIPDAKWGEAVLAVVVPRPGAAVDTARLVELVKQRKGAQHAPKRIELANALPLTALGKIDKKVLRAPYWMAAGRQVA